MINTIFKENKYIVSDIINRLLNSMQINTLIIYDEKKEKILGLYEKIEQIYITRLEDIPDGSFLFLRIYGEKDLNVVFRWIERHQNENDFLIYLAYNFEKKYNFNEAFGKPFNLKKFSLDKGSFYLKGKTFQCIEEVPSDFKVLAIIHMFNESDIIFKLLNYLISQELDIYIIDNWSNDGSYEIVEDFQKKYPERIFLEHFPIEGPNEFYEWYNQLRRTEEISKMLSYDWFIHYDVDEMRISPWENITLRHAIYHIDKLGYNLIENTVIDFKLTQKSNKNIFMENVYFDFGHRSSHFMQVKTWKRTRNIDLKESGGHMAVINEPKIFPLKILNRHYPFRNIEQAVKKVFKYRKPRFEKENNERVWHGHYDFIQEEKDFIQNSSNLLKWSKDTFYEYYPPLFMGCGISTEEVEIEFEVKFSPLYNKKIIIYGAGKIGRKFYQYYIKTCDIIAWVDQKYEILPYLFCEKILSPSIIYELDYDYLVIAIGKKDIRDKIKSDFINDGINPNKII